VEYHTEPSAPDPAGVKRRTGLETRAEPCRFRLVVDVKLVKLNCADAGTADRSVRNVRIQNSRERDTNVNLEYSIAVGDRKIVRLPRNKIKAHQRCENEDETAAIELSRGYVDALEERRGL